MEDHADRLLAEFQDCLPALGISKTCRVVAAVSGGLDSMVLLQLMVGISDGHRPKIQVAHLNHGLRGRESDQDQAFVEAACRRYGLPFLTKTLAAGQVSGTRKQSVEEAARSIRYAWLEEIAVASHADFVLTAHHEDDQLETVVHNLIRGSGFRGIQGMRSVRCLKSTVRLVRPLLEVSRSRLSDYAEDQRIAFREDLSNADLAFTRNRLRHQVLPALLEQGGAEVAAELFLLAKSASQTTEILDRLSHQVALACIVTRTANHVLLRARPVAEMPDFVAAHFFTWLWMQQNWARQKMTSKHWGKLSEAVSKDEFKRFQVPGRVDVSSVSGFVRLVRTSSN